jgi:hypothetical protein
MHGKQLIISRGLREFEIVNVHVLLPTPTALRQLSAGGFDENAPHGFRGRAKKVRSVLESGLAIRIHETEPRFVNERGRLQGLAWQLPSHLDCRNLPQLGIDEFQQTLTGSIIAIAGRLQQMCNVVGHRAFIGP